MSESELLYLFSSDQAVRYTQDILNILAAPAGLPYRFRYDQRWVTDSARNRWEDGSLVGQEGLVCFSLQQAKEYTPAAFVPVRRIEVAKTERVGTHLFVHFRLRDLVALSRAPDRPIAEAVPLFTEFVRTHTTGPYDAWASLSE